MFSFNKYKMNDTNAIRLVVATSGTSDVEAGELIYMNAGVPTPLATATAAGVTKYLVAEDFDASEDSDIILYDLSLDHELVGVCASACVAGTQYEVNAGAITIGTTAPQVEIIKKPTSTKAVFKIV